MFFIENLSPVLKSLKIELVRTRLCELKKDILLSSRSTIKLMNDEEPF